MAITIFSFCNSPIFLILIAIITLFLYLFLFTTKRNSKNLPPGNLGFPVLGETLKFLRASREGDPAKFISERVKRHKSPHIFKTSLMGEPMVMLCGSGGNKFLFGNENKLVTIWWPGSVRKLFGNCLLTCVGEEAKRMRRVLSSFLSPDAFARLYITTMDRVTQQHIQTHWQGVEEVKVYEIIKLYAFEVACRLFMSLEDPIHISKLATQFNIFLKGVIEIPLNIPGTRFYSAMRAAANIRKELHIITKQRKVDLERKIASPSQDLLSHLLVSCDEDGRSLLSEAEIVNNILVLLFAGHDTSTVTITLLMKYLGELPDVYDKVLKEQMHIVESKEAGDTLHWEDIQKMRYSRNVVSEVLRLSPPIIGGFREALVDFEYAGYTIPKGWKLYWSTVWTQNDEKFFPNNPSFDATRFEGAGPTPFTYVPFGGGARMCVGKEFARLEILIFLHNVIKRFNWDLLIPNEKIIYDPMPTPIKGLPVRLRPHNFGS